MSWTTIVTDESIKRVYMEIRADERLMFIELKGAILGVYYIRFFTID